MHAPAARGVRGNALLITLIALAVLMLMTVGAIEFTGINRRAAVSQLSGDRMAACAETARRYLISRLNVFQLPRNLKLDQTLLDDPIAADRSKMMTAHYADDIAGATVVAVASESFSAARQQSSELANNLPTDTTRNGGYFRVVVKCKESVNREAELEFLFRYGL